MIKAKPDSNLFLEKYDFVGEYILSTSFKNHLIFSQPKKYFFFFIVLDLILAI
jgi:hypothetical protein